MSPNRTNKVIEAVLRAYYRHIGTPAPAPGIERLAALAVDTGLPLMREEWEEEMLDSKVLAAAEAALGPDPSVREIAQAIIQATAAQRIRKDK